MMRLKADEYELLKRVHWELITLGRKDLAEQLQAIITRYEEKREINRELWREARRNKTTVGRIPRPKKDKYNDAGIRSLASSIDEAKFLAFKAWKNGNYILDAEHFKNVEFIVREETE